MALVVHPLYTSYSYNSLGSTEVWAAEIVDQIATNSDAAIAISPDFDAFCPAGESTASYPIGS